MTYHINPATGLPMTGDDYSGVDVGGNLYGSTRASLGQRPFGTSCNRNDVDPD